MSMRRLLSSFVIIVILLVGSRGTISTQIVHAQTDPCAGLPAYTQIMLAEEQRYVTQMLATLDLNDMRAIAAATPDQLTTVVEIIEQHLKNLDQIDPPLVAVDWQMAITEDADLTQAAFADGAINGIFTILVDYYDQSVRSDREVAEARAAATAACPDFEAFAARIDEIDGDDDTPAPGFAPWSVCAGLDQLGIDITRANLQGLVDVPAALPLLIAFADEWDTDPSIGWNQLQLLSLADYYVAVANYLEQLATPDYAAAWLQHTIELDRALADVLRGAQGIGIIQAGAANGQAIAVANTALDQAIASATQVCPQFGQFAEEN